MIRSIHWTLLLWYAVVLILILGAFGAATVIYQREGMLGELEGRLDGHCAILAESVEDERFEDDDDDDGEDSQHGHQDEDEEEEFEFEMPRRQSGIFAPDVESAPYFVIWDGAGVTAAASRPGLEVPRPSLEGARERDGRLEVSRPGRDRSWVLVGQSIQPIRDAVAAFTRKVFAAGAGSLLFTLVGGWTIARLALRPVRRISDVASEISAKNLTSRVDTRRTATELQTLARTLNAAFDRLQEAVQHQRRFTADASHELRTPISSILVSAEHALTREREPREYQEVLEAVVSEARRMSSLTSVLMSMAEADSGVHAIPRKSIDLGDVVGDAVEVLRSEAAGRDVHVEWNTASEEVLGNRDLLLEMAINLVSNAILHNRHGGRVRLSLRREESVRLQVEDDGPGIPAEDLPHIFERFYRVEKARTRKSGGSGLGLAITKWIIEEHGGSISVSSEPGSGTVFSVDLPSPVA